MPGAKNKIDKTDVNVEIANEIASDIIAKDIQNEMTAEIEAKQDREQLIAEACKLQGRVEAFEAVSKFTTVGSLLTLRMIKDEKIYRHIPNITTWESFCKSIGFSVNKIDEDLKNLEVFGTDFLTTVGTIGIGYRELRQLKRATSDGTLSIEADSVIVDGEVIPLSDKDELKDALEKVISEKNNALKLKDKELKAKDDLNTLLSQKREEAENEADKTRAELEKLKFAKLNGVDAADRPDFNMIRECENSAMILYRNLLSLAERDDLSKFNEQLLGGVTMMMFQLAEDIRITLAGKGGAYFDRMYLSDEELENSKKLVTPSRLY